MMLQRTINLSVAIVFLVALTCCAQEMEDYRSLPKEVTITHETVDKDTINETVDEPKEPPSCSCDCSQKGDLNKKSTAQQDQDSENDLLIERKSDTKYNIVMITIPKKASLSPTVEEVLEVKNVDKGEEEVAQDEPEDLNNDVKPRKEESGEELEVADEVPIPADFVPQEVKPKKEKTKDKEISRKAKLEKKRSKRSTKKNRQDFSKDGKKKIKSRK